jgi:ATP-dependent DNA helicase PIF1
MSNMDLSILSEEQQYAYRMFSRKENMFITGAGGTGKTRLIEYLVKRCKSMGSNYQVCAMTGCAALLLPKICNARTLHSWSGIRLCKGDPTNIVELALKNKRTRATWRKTEVLIVDEVSMMSVKVIEVLNIIAKTARVNQKPFGGMQVVFVGDFYQLPPVGTNGDADTDKFCFESDIWSTLIPKMNHIELKTIFRQTDPKYREILLQIRKSELSDDNAEILRKCLHRDFDSEQHNGCVPTKLYPTRAKTEQLNATMFSKLTGNIKSFACDKKSNCSTYLESNKPLSPNDSVKCKSLHPAVVEYETQQLMSTSSYTDIMYLKVGAVVMCTVNLDMENGICNGSQGVVSRFVKNDLGKYIPEVTFSNGITKIIEPYFKQSDEYPTVAVGQIPLCLAWALTIHKIQGATLTMADIDVGSQIFECGQTYVALSRVKSMDGLYLSAFSPDRIRANETVSEFYRSLPNIDMTIMDTTDANIFSSFELKEEQYDAEPDPNIKRIIL